MVDVSARKVPVSYWIVCLLAFFVDIFGGYDYVMIRMQDDEYLRSMQARIPSLIIDWYDKYPLWADIAWAAFTWSAVVGAVLLLARSRYASTAFLVSTIAAVEIGRASCRERVCQYVSISVVGVSLKKKKKKNK